MTEISRALYILLVGMGLTFFGMLLVWGSMILLEKAFKNREEKKEEAIDMETRLNQKIPGINFKTNAAVAAVAIAVIQQRTMQAVSAAVSILIAAQGEGLSRKEKPAPIISSWLITHRQEQNNLRNQINNRKSRGEHP